MKLIQHRWVSPIDMNSGGSLFGGRLLSWMDEDSSMCIHNCCIEDVKFTTVALEASFLSPATLADRLKFEYLPIFIGKSSAIISCKCFNFYSKQEIAEAYATFCCIDGFRRPIPITEEILLPHVLIEEMKRKPEWELGKKLREARLKK